MLKRQLHRFRIPTPHLFRNLRGSKLHVPSVTDTHTSTTTKAIPRPTDIPTDAPEREHKQVLRRLGSRSPWKLFWTIALLLLGVSGGLGMLWLAILPPLPDCQNLSPFAAPGEQLYCAQMAAQSGKLDRIVAAMKSVEGWSPDDPLYDEANRLMGQWSQDIVSAAREKVRTGDLKAGVDLASLIPATSPLYTETQAAIASWQQEWQQGEEITRKFQDAAKAQKWKQAWQQVEALLNLDFDYWRSSKHDQLMQQLTAEQQGRQLIQEARAIAVSNTTEALTTAIARAGKVKPNTYAKAQAQAERNNWSRALLHMAATLFRSQNFAGAIATAQRVPVDDKSNAEAKDWIGISRASIAVQQNHLLAYLDALSVVRQVDPKSPVYQQASARESLWKSHLQDQMHLKFARTIAGIDQPLTLPVAIDQAKKVSPKRPEGIQAQKLITSWRKEVQQIENRSALANARNLASLGTIESLKAAVARASQISPSQPQRIEAQKAIAQWTKEIQTIEDQPTLDLARTFAKQGDLSAAVLAAQKIRPNRALYNEAQAAVKGWASQLQLVQDQPILDAANALAAQGRLDAAIQTASQIQLGRALYNEATEAIGIWKKALNPTPAPTPPDSGSTSNNAVGSGG